MSDAEAFEIAQPDPSKARSVITSFSTCTYRLRRSPQSGLNPSAWCVGDSIVLKFLGRRLWSRITSW
jgi:hypothetical protein